MLASGGLSTKRKLKPDPFHVFDVNMVAPGVLDEIQKAEAVWLNERILDMQRQYNIQVTCVPLHQLFLCV